MRIGDLVEYNVIGNTRGVGVIVEVQERAGVGNSYHVRWACGTLCRHRKQWLIKLNTSEDT